MFVPKKTPPIWKTTVHRRRKQWSVVERAIVAASPGELPEDIITDPTKEKQFEVNVIREVFGVTWK